MKKETDERPSWFGPGDEEWFCKYHPKLWAIIRYNGELLCIDCYEPHRKGGFRQELPPNVNVEPPGLCI